MADIVNSELITPPQKTIVSALLVDEELKAHRAKRAKKAGKKNGQTSTADLISAFKAGQSPENSLSELEKTTLNQSVHNSIDDFFSEDALDTEGAKDADDEDNSKERPPAESYKDEFLSPSISPDVSVDVNVDLDVSIDVGIIKLESITEKRRHVLDRILKEIKN